MVAATAAAINDGAPILNFGAPSSDVTTGLTSIEHLTFPILLIDGNPRIGEARAVIAGFWRREEVEMEAEMDAIFFSGFAG